MAISANDTIRIGIIGCGGIANGKHMPGLRSIENVEMVAFCDIIEEKAQQAAKDYGTEDAKVYTDYKKLLEDKTIDVVHVCTPNRSHSFITVDALEAGKHVMCEKPMAINSEEAKKMLDAAERTGKKLCIGYQNRYRPEMLYLKKEAEDGTFGDIYYSEAIAIRRRAVPTWGVFINEYEQGGGPLIDIGTHSLDLTLWITNNYKPKYCVGTSYHKLNGLAPELQGNTWGPWDSSKYTAEDSAFGFVVMENGATILVKSSWALNYEPSLEASTLICGTLAGADFANGLQINGVRNGRQYIMKPNFGAGGVAFFDGDNSAALDWQNDWINSLRNDTEVIVHADQAYCVTRILEGIYTSAATGDVYKF